MNYELRAVVFHGGEDNAGHYTALTKRPGNTEWYFFVVIYFLKNVFKADNDIIDLI